jgi:hypothetical protein
MVAENAGPSRALPDATAAAIVAESERKQAVLF